MKSDKRKSDDKITETILDFIIHIPMFDGLNATQLKIIARYMNFFEIKSGEYLFKEGDKGDFVCFVAEGKLDVLKHSTAGGDIVIATLPAGRSIGEMSVIDNTPRSASVLARTNSTLVTLSKKGFDIILDDHPKIGIQILKGISRLLSLNMRKTSSRLADYMLSIT